MDMSVSSNESVNGTETMNEQIEERKKNGEKNPRSALGFQSSESFETNNYITMALQSIPNLTKSNTFSSW